MYGNEDLEISKETILEILKEINTFKNESEYALDRDVSNKSLSSGQMQKIGFIRSLLSNPDIILLDESTSNLDTDSKNIVFEKLKNTKATVINSTHDPENFDFVDHHYEILLVEENRKVNKLF